MSLFSEIKRYRLPKKIEEVKIFGLAPSKRFSTVRKNHEKKY